MTAPTPTLAQQQAAALAALVDVLDELPAAFTGRLTLPAVRDVFRRMRKALRDLADLILAGLDAEVDR